MLTFNLTPILKARGISKPHKFFTSNGFSPSYATRLVKNDIRSIQIDYLEKLCTILNCTPNDLIEWTPSKENEKNKSHPLQPLLKNDIDAQFSQTIQNL